MPQHYVMGGSAQTTDLTLGSIDTVLRRSHRAIPSYVGAPAADCVDGVLAWSRPGGAVRKEHASRLAFCVVQRVVWIRRCIKTWRRWNLAGFRGVEMKHADHADEKDGDGNGAGWRLQRTCAFSLFRL